MSNTHETTSPTPDADILDDLVGTLGGRTRRNLGRLMPDHEPKVTITEDADGTMIAHVELFGRHGVRKQMRLLADDWANLSALFGTQWVVMPGGSRGSFVVTSGRSQATGGGKGRVTVARLLSRAEPKQVVVYRDGSFLNLRRSNLVTLSQFEALQLRRARTLILGKA